MLKRHREPENYLDEADDVFAGHLIAVIPGRGESLLRTMGWNGEHEGSGAKRAVQVPSFGSSSSTSSTTVFVNRKAKQLHEVTSKQDHFGLGYSGSLKTSNRALQEDVEMGGISLTQDRKIEYSQSIGFSSEESSDDDDMMMGGRPSSQFSRKRSAAPTENNKKQTTRCTDGTLALLGFQVYVAALGEGPFAMNTIKPVAGMPHTFNTRRRFEAFSATPIYLKHRRKKLGGKLIKKKKIISLEERFASNNKSNTAGEEEGSSVLKEKFAASGAKEGSGNEGAPTQHIHQQYQYGLQIMKGVGHGGGGGGGSGGGGGEGVSTGVVSKKLALAPVHTIKTWVPVPLLCKRFHVPQPVPLPDQPSSSNDAAANGGGVGVATNMSTVELLTRTTGATSEKERGNAEEEEEEGEEEEEEDSALPHERAALDLLKSLFDHPLQVPDKNSGGKGSGGGGGGGGGGKKKSKKGKKEKREKKDKKEKKEKKAKKEKLRKEKKKLKKDKKEKKKIQKKMLKKELKEDKQKAEEQRLLDMAQKFLNSGK